MTYDVKYTTLEPIQLSDNPPSFDIDDTDGHVIANNGKETIVTVQKYWRRWWWQHQRIFQFCRLEVEELYNRYVSTNINIMNSCKPTLSVPSKVLAMTTLFKESVASPVIDLSLRFTVPE